MDNYIRNKIEIKQDDEIRRLISEANKIQPIPIVYDHVSNCIPYNPYIVGSSSIYVKNRKTTIIDINIIVPNKVVEFTFADGNKQKMVCDEVDTFSLENAISFAITKQLLGGTSAYNKAIKDGMKVYEDKSKREEIEKEKQTITERKKEKNRRKKEAWKRRKAEERREEQIQIQAEAYIRAMDKLRMNEVHEVVSGS